MPEDNNAVGFKTTLFGFKKADVLACIDKMAAESQEKEKQADTRELELQDTVNALKADKNVLLEKTREVCDQLTAQKKCTDEAEKKTASLNLQLRRAEEEAALFKKRLFEKEKEARGLKNENTLLADRLREQQQIAEDAVSARQQAQQEMERTIAAAEQAAQRQAETAQQTAQQRIAAAEQAAQQQAEAAEQAAQQRAETAQQTAQQRIAAAEQAARQQIAQAEQDACRQVSQAKEAAQKEALLQKSAMKASAQEIADSVSVLKEQLSEVDAKIAQAAEQLNRTTAALHTALDDAEENVRLLGAQMQQFPQSAPGARMPRPSDPQPASRAGTRTQNSPGKTLSALLLDKLTRMLGE